MTKTVSDMQAEIMDLKRKNIDLQQRLDVFQYKLTEDGADLIYTNGSRRSLHESLLTTDRMTPDRPRSNGEMSTSMIWSSVWRKNKSKISQEDEIFDERGRSNYPICFNNICFS